MKPATYHEACERYGAVDLRSHMWTGEARWMVLFDVPYEIALGWLNLAGGRGMPTHRIYCNQDIVEPLTQSLDNMQDADVLRELRTFDGCFEIRAVRGSFDNVSAHAFGLAIDVNAAENPTGTTPTLTPRFVKCWEEAGFDWGGRFQSPRGMHFS